MDAFDADVLIYAAVPGHPLGEQVAALFRSAAPATVAGIGSVLLLPEVLAKPLRDDATNEVRILAALLARLDLRPVDRATAELATALSSRYRLKAADATHLATAVGMGADRFITNNKRDFPPTITEIQVTYPADLAAPIVISARWKACWPNWSAAAAPRYGKSRPRSGAWATSPPSLSAKATDPVRSTWAGLTQPATTPAESTPCRWMPGRSGSVGRPTSMGSVTCRARTTRQGTWLFAFPCPTASPTPWQLPAR